MSLFGFARFKKGRGRPPRFTLADAHKIDALGEAVAAMRLKVERALQREERSNEELQARIAQLEAENAKLRAELEAIRA
jgi:hypothetical protein